METNKKKYEHGKNPNSIRNLKPVKKGEVRNPFGAAMHDAEKRKWKGATVGYVREIIDIVVMGQPSDLEKIYTAPEGSGAPENGKRVLAKFVHDAIATGNWSSIERLLERVLGKVPDRIEHTVETQAVLSEEEMKAALAAIEGR